MYETKNISLSKSAQSIFNLLLLLFPSSYRKQFGEEMRILFLELYQDELRRNGKIEPGFWFLQIGDITTSAVNEHIDVMKQKGMKKYFQQTFGINKFNIVGGILLLPILSVTTIDIFARIAQGDLVHYNRPVYALLSHSPLYWYPVLLVWILLFPFLAIGINLIPIVQSIIKKKTNIWSITFVKRNFVSLLLLCIGMGFIALIRLHDFAPCFIHGLFKVGIGNLPKIWSVCRNA